MGIDHLYARLPRDIQNEIKRFFHIWERFGLEKEPSLSEPDSYYTEIRSIPRSFRWDSQSPHKFYYRRQRDYFQWTLTHYTLTDNDKGWTIRMIPQWEQDSNDLVMALHHGRFYNNIPFPGQFLGVVFYNDNDNPSYCEMLIMFKTPVGSTHQASIVMMTDYVKELNRIVQRNKRWLLHR